MSNILLILEKNVEDPISFLKEFGGALQKKLVEFRVSEEILFFCFVSNIILDQIFSAKIGPKSKRCFYLK